MAVIFKKNLGSQNGLYVHVYRVGQQEAAEKPHAHIA